MKVFVSSVIRGFEPFREAAVRAAQTLGHEVIRAEDFGASPDSPQQVCLAGCVGWLGHQGLGPRGSLHIKNGNPISLEQAITAIGSGTVPVQMSKAIIGPTS